MTENNQKDGRKDWSSSFIRVRTELSVTAMIFLAIVWLDMDLTKFPVLGVTLSHPAPKGIIIAFLLCIFLYFAAALCVKYWRENAQIRESAETLNEAEKTLRQSIDRLEAFTPPDHLHEIAKYTTVIEEEYKKYEVLCSDQFRTLAKWRDDRWKRTDTDALRNGRELVAVTAVEGPLTAAEVKSLHEQYSAIMQENKKLFDTNFEGQVKELAARGEHFLSRIDATMSDAIDSMNRNIEIAKSNIKAQGPDIQQALKEVTDKADALRAEMRSLAGAIAWDHLVFGFWVPFSVACVAVLLSLPRAYIQMRPALTVVAACLPDHLLACSTPEPPSFFALAWAAMRSVLGL